MMKPHPALLPFLELCDHIFGDKHDIVGLADPLVFLRIPPGRNQRQDGVSIRRRNGQPAIAGFITLIHHQAKPELIHIELQTTILIADKDVDAENTKIGTLPIEAEHSLFRQTR
jgi:hypothetical protein